MIAKCDLCKKEIKNEPITAGLGFLAKNQLCERCGSPILEFLEKHKLADKDKIACFRGKTPKKSG